MVFEPTKSPQPDLLAELVEQLKRLPGIGEKGAQRLALFLIRSPAELSESLARVIAGARRNTTLCPICFNLSAGDEPCDICANQDRDPGLLCVVETPADLKALEKSRSYRGRYHILHGTLSPLDEIGPDELKISELFARLEKESCREVILALNPNMKGEATAHYLAQKLKSLGIKITRIASGVPAGSELEYLDRLTIEQAIKYRREWD
ncbi:MAG: recombination mediator RecR [Proteobacteria bacterium]|nr:recombination mediator RecR [Pseudomonadota bacterium]